MSGVNRPLKILFPLASRIWARSAIDGIAAGERVLGPQPLEDPLRRVPLPGWPPLVFFQNRVDRP
jgi:hypothetical protein